MYVPINLVSLFRMQLYGLHEIPQCIIVNEVKYKVAGYNLEETSLYHESLLNSLTTTSHCGDIGHVVGSRFKTMPQQLQNCEI